METNKVRQELGGDEQSPKYYILGNIRMVTVMPIGGAVGECKYCSIRCSGQLMR